MRTAVMTGAEVEWTRVEAAFDAVVELGPEERTTALDRLGEEDPALRLRVESLLAHAQFDDSFLDRPAIESFAPAAEKGSLSPGVRIGAYCIVNLVGRGGSGEVYAAERADGHFHQRVALKLIRHDAADQLDRFEAERQILANLNHPGIARVFDGGLTPDGQPYMVMEYVEGHPIVQWCRVHGASLEIRLRLFLQICEATSFAHQHLVVHRDLKPNNVFVTHDGTVKLLDFGAAKLLSHTSHEHTRSAPMTPAYAAPEQLENGPITTATDVYALGLLLFELLSGEPPLKLHKLSVAAALEAVLHRELPRLSDFAAKQANPPVVPRALRGDFDAIVARAVRKEAARRYHTVDALREDVRASIEGRPVEARDGNLGYLLDRAMRRHKVLAGSALAVALALAGGGIGMGWQAQLARAEARKEAAVKEFLLNIFRTNSVDNPDGASARQTTAEQLLDRGAKSVTDGLTDAPEVRAELIDALADLYDELEEFSKVEALERQRLADLTRVEGHRSSPARAQALAELGRALAMSDRYVEAGTVLRDALVTLDALGDDRSAARVQALTSLGLVDYHVLAATDPAAGAHTATALAILEKYNPNSPDRLSAVQLLARIADRRHDVAEAERGYRSFLSLTESPAFQGQRAALGSALADLGGFLAQEHRYGEAASLLERAVDVLDQAEGPDQLEAAVARGNLGNLYTATNRPVEAERLFRAALASIERTQGADNGSATSATRLALANLEHARGRFAEAQTLIERNLAVLRAHSSTQIAEQAETTGAWARLLYDEGRYADSYREQSNAAVLFGKLDQPHSEAEALNRLTAADLAASANRNEEAARGYAAIAKAWQPPSVALHAPYVFAQLGVGESHLRAGDFAAATQVALELTRRIDALPMNERSPGWEARVHGLAGRAALAARDPEAAVQHLRRAVDLRQSFDDAQSPFLAQARRELHRAMASSAALSHRAGSTAPEVHASATPVP